MTTTDDHGNLHNPEGRFATKANSRPSGELSDTAPNGDHAPLSIRILSEPHPQGGFDLAFEAPTGRYYLRDGNQHREDGPAYEGFDGTEEWRQDGELHRDGAPAVIHSDGTPEFWEHGQPISIG